MEWDWRKQVLRLIEEQGLTMKALSLRAGLSASTMQSYITDGHSPSIDKFLRIADALGVSPEYLLTGGATRTVSIPIVGIVSAGEGWAHVDPGHGDAVVFEAGDSDLIAIDVRGDSMSPVYRNGDTLVCRRRPGRFGDNLIGRDCVVLTRAGEGYVKILRRGSRPGFFNLTSYNPVFDAVEDVQLQWIAPIAWIKRGDA